MTFAPKPEELPKPEEAPKPKEVPKPEEAPRPEETPTLEEAPKPEVVERKPTAPWEAPQDLEIVIEKFDVVPQKPEEVAIETTTAETTKVVKEEGTFSLA